MLNVKIPVYHSYRGKILDTCPYFTITAHHWYPTDINAHTFTGTNGDTFTLPDALLEVPVLPEGGMSPFACQKIHFIEYHTEHWFLTNTKASALNNKVSKAKGVSFSNQQANCVNFGFRTILLL